jgi:hypothetical protein
MKIAGKSVWKSDTFQTEIVIARAIVKYFQYGLIPLL